MKPCRPRGPLPSLEALAQRIQGRSWRRGRMTLHRSRSRRLHASRTSRMRFLARSHHGPKKPRRFIRSIRHSSTLGTKYCIGHLRLQGPCHIQVLLAPRQRLPRAWLIEQAWVGRHEQSLAHPGLHRSCLRIRQGHEKLSVGPCVPATLPHLPVKLSSRSPRSHLALLARMRERYQKAQGRILTRIQRKPNSRDAAGQTPWQPFPTQSASGTQAKKIRSF